MDRLEKILFNLSHLNLKDDIVDKQAHASGLGGSCDVYSAWSKQYQKKVAIKQIRAFLKKDISLAKTLAKEIRIWAKLNHVNVLSLLGYFTEGDGAMPALVSEWMEKGTLNDFMKTFPRASSLTCSLLFGVASGLAYLHSQKIIHADLKTHNVLISADNQPLLADFGLSLALSQSTTGTTTTGVNNKGTLRWMAKELLASGDPSETGISSYNEATDMWAFGMVVYELLSWKIPFWKKSKDVYVLMAIIKGELPEEPDKCPEATCFDTLWGLCQSCWGGYASRPSAVEVGRLISSEIEKDKIKNQPLSLNTEFQIYEKPPNFNGLVWHWKGHNCHVKVEDGEVFFDCDSSFLLGPIVNVEVTENRVNAIYPFDITLWAWSRKKVSDDSNLVFSGISSHRISVSSSDDAYACREALAPARPACNSDVLGSEERIVIEVSPPSRPESPVREYPRRSGISLGMDYPTHKFNNPETTSNIESVPPSNSPSPVVSESSSTEPSTMREYGVVVRVKNDHPERTAPAKKVRFLNQVALGKERPNVIPNPKWWDDLAFEEKYYSISGSDTGDSLARAIDQAHLDGIQGSLRSVAEVDFGRGYAENLRKYRRDF